MPRAKGKDAGAKKNARLYSMPQKLSEGTILKDISKVEWCIGTSIGVGGFGEIYTACKLGEDTYKYVVKCEPHENGPLFVEMHFYMRIGRLDSIKKFQKSRGLKRLGMPHMVGNGSMDINGIRHRFIVLPRYGSDIAKCLLSNGGRLPEVTAYRIAIQMIDVYEFIHSNGYIHADLKATNILLGYGPNGGSQTYLVDFGLASRYATQEFKPDAKKMHNGTIEYTSRDAHLGVATMRADFEILGYNLIEWLGVKLPWVKANLLAVPANVQTAKQNFLDNIATNLLALFPSKVPTAISEYMKYVVKLKYNDTPNYDMIRKMFTAALSTLNAPVTGDLIFNSSILKRYDSLPTTSKKAAALNGKRDNNDNSEEDELRDASDDDDDYDEIIEKRELIGNKRDQLKRSQKVQRNAQKEKKLKTIKSPSHQNKYRKIIKKSAIGTPSPEIHRVSGVRKSPRILQQNSSATEINVSDHIKSPRGTPQTILNNRITPNSASSKTYQFNFELDVSMDANVVVNVKRKKKSTQPEHKNESVGIEPIKVTTTGKITTPVTRAKKSVTPKAVIKRVRRN